MDNSWWQHSRIRLVVIWRIGEMFPQTQANHLTASTPKNKTNQYDIGDKEMICCKTYNKGFCFVMTNPLVKDVSTTLERILNSWGQFIQFFLYPNT